MPSKFLLRFNRPIFEYDLYNLIRSFYPMAEVKILYEGETAEGEDWEGCFDVQYTDSSIRMSVGLTAYGASHGKLLDNEALSEINRSFSFTEGILRSAEESDSFEIDRKPEAKVSNLPAQQDLPVQWLRLQSGDVWRNEPITAVAEISDWENRPQTKNEVKAFAYDILSLLSGKTLPWGDLTGIRPTKITMQLLESGKYDAEILQIMQNTYRVNAVKSQLALETVKREKEAISRLHDKTGYSLYIGIPFCPSICLYCSFGSHRLDVYRDMVQPYLRALYRELAFIAEEMKGWNLDSIYIGGGTPTSLTAEQMRELLTEVSRLFDTEHVAEYTVEAGRPDTITREKLEVLREFPVSRISINPQTMNQKTLDLIGRRHTIEDIIQTFRMARELGFDNINMDLIIGLPGEGEADVLHTLEEIRKLDPESLTIHSLALKRATRLNLFKEKYEPISFETSAELMDHTAETAHQMGMTPYYLYRQKNMAGNFENVGYAKPGKAGIYNILIMEERQSILAAGSGASTKFVFEDGARIERSENVKDLKNYIERVDEMCERKKLGIDTYLKNNGEKE